MKVRDVDVSSSSHFLSFLRHLWAIESYENNNAISFPIQVGKTTELSRRERYAYCLHGQSRTWCLLLKQWSAILCLQFLIAKILKVGQMYPQIFLILWKFSSCSQRGDRETKSSWALYEVARARKNRPSQERFRYQ